MTQIELLKSNIKNEIDDPRRTSHGHILHPLSTILMIAFLATLCGVTTYVSMEVFAITKKRWLAKFLDLDHGIPDSDTIRRCLERVDPTSLARCLYGWLGVFGLNVKIIHIDGKTIRGSGDYLSKAIHVLTAFCSDYGVTLAEMTVPGKENEITVAKDFLDGLPLKGCMVTGDAIFCQRDICHFIAGKKGGYCFVVKGNQPTLLEDIQLQLSKSDNIQTDTVLEKGHGRIETREYRFTTDIEGIDPENKWSGLRAIGSVKRTVEAKGEITTDTRYFITTSKEFELFKKATRSHWGIENGLHWPLDMIFAEDACTVQAGNAPLNLNILRKTSLNLVNQGQKQINFKLSRKDVLNICKYNSYALESLVNRESLSNFLV